MQKKYNFVKIIKNIYWVKKVTITSFSFILFFAVLLVCYFLLPKKMQWLILLIFSYAFYYLVGGSLPVYILVTTVVTYLATNLIFKLKKDVDKTIADNKEMSKDEKKELRFVSDKKRKAILITAICINIGMLAVFKYTKTFAGFFGTTVNLLLPLGISFYTFQSIGYMVDVYRKKVDAEKNLFKTALFLSYFPQMIQGPIGRFGDLAPQLFEQHSFSFERLKKGVMLILWGFVKKLVIANNLSPLTHEITVNYQSYEGPQILIGMMLFGIQLYADFSGYMDIVSGFSSVLGIELAENFKRPYLSKNVTEFWRRWHMSLCFWFRDYVFYSIFMSKKMMNLAKKLRAKDRKTAAKNVPTYIAMIVVWFLTGLWHNLNGPQIFWGLANGLIMIAAVGLKANYEKACERLHISAESKFWNLIRILRTYFIMTLLNFFSEFQSLGSIGSCTGRFFTTLIPTGLSLSYLLPKTVDIGIVGIVMTFVACIALLAHSLYEEKHGSLIEKICTRNWLLQLFVFIVLLFTTLLFGGLSETGGGFMYAQF